MSILKRPMAWFKIPKPDPAKEFIGRVIVAYPTAEDAKRRTNGVKLEIEHIRGNMRHQAMFEINGTHLVSMLDAYHTINGEQLPNQEMHEAFLSTIAEQITPDLGPKPLDAPRKPVLHG